MHKTHIFDQNNNAKIFDRSAMEAIPFTDLSYTDIWSAPLTRGVEEWSEAHAVLHVRIRAMFCKKLDGSEVPVRHGKMEGGHSTGVLFTHLQLSGVLLLLQYNSDIQYIPKLRVFNLQRAHYNGLTEPSGGHNGDVRARQLCSTVYGLNLEC